MNNIRRRWRTGALALILVMLGSAASSSASVQAQSFDFRKLEKAIQDYTVILDMKVELSFGMQTNEQEQRLLGTIVTEDGLVIFDGSGLDFEHPFASLSGVSFKATPTNIEVTMLDGRKFSGEYLGVDRFTRIGALKITDAGDTKFQPVQFVGNQKFEVGQWVALYMLLPEYVEPPLAADIGMLSTIVEAPEAFPLTVGFSELQMTSVVFNENMQPVGVLGELMNPSVANTDASGMLESMGRFEFPMLGIVTADRLEKLIADPPMKGETDRGWLGITLQALTPDIAGFLGVDVPGGIIVNNIVKGSPAETAGLKVGDVIYEVNGQQVEVNKDEKLPVFQRAISEMGPGTSVEFSILRPAETGIDTLKVTTLLEEAPLAATDAPEYESKSLEFKVRDLVFADYLFFNLDEDELSGAIVSELKQGGLAAVGGLQIGDVIQRIGSTDITSVDDVKTAVEQIEQEKPAEVIFFVWRDNKTLFVNVKTDW